MMIQITESKMEGLSENIRKGLRYLGKAMQCIEEMTGDDGYGERDYDERREDYNERNGRRWSDDDYGMRQGVKGTGPYSRYR